MQNKSNVMSEDNSSAVDESGAPPNEHVMILIFGFLLVEGVLVIAINAFVIFLILHKRILQTTTNLCLGSLALSDMMTGLYVIPLIVTCSTLPYYDFNVCLAMDLGHRFLAISTILHLLVITIDRYHYIVASRTTAPAKMTKKLATRIFSSLWGVSLILSCVQLFWSHEDDNTKSKYDVIYDIIILCVVVLLPLVIMVVAYTKIFCALRRQLQKIKRHASHISRKSNKRHNRKERKAILIYSLMITVYVVGWFNYFFHTLYHDLNLDYPDMPFWVNTFLLYLKFSTGLLNPILYTFLKQDFKKARRSLRWCRSYRRHFSGSTSASEPSQKSTSLFRDMISLRLSPSINRFRGRDELVSYVSNC